ncbi:MAG: phospholipase A [Rhodoferax sp.]|nr:phospholipase A [Rhodoferax sp.]
MHSLVALFTLFLIAIYALTASANDQNVGQATATPNDWQACRALASDAAARLRCFDAWAAQQRANDSANKPSTEPVVPLVITITPPDLHNCKDTQYSELSRYWELEVGSDCGAFGIRGYRPISLSWLGSDSVNTQPTSPAPLNNAIQLIPYRTDELRVGLSVRTKIAQGLLTQAEPLRRDSLWFAYSQQSNWQLFSGDLSRPFRTTDHEPELIYIYPLDAALPWGWRLRYAGISLNHQSNGQPLPYSRSWNRTILMAGAERGHDFYVQAKLWQRLPEPLGDDDNPDISDRVGRGELAGFWSINANNTWGLTLRHALSANANGSVRLEWLRKLGDSGVPGNRSGLRFHTQLFSGYGDSLIDYNRRRMVLSLGLSLVDW